MWKHPSQSRLQIVQQERASERVQDLFVARATDGFVGRADEENSTNCRSRNLFRLAQMENSDLDQVMLDLK